MYALTSQPVTPGVGAAEAHQPGDALPLHQGEAAWPGGAGHGALPVSLLPSLSLSLSLFLSLSLTHTHTQTHTYIYIDLSIPCLPAPPQVVT